jgi:Zn-finger nucleic acid-binding protein
MDCPICSKTMAQRESGGFTIDVCDEHGLWLDQKELYLINEAKRRKQGSFTLGDLIRVEKHPPADPERVLPCPRCGEPMRTERYHEVMLDWCPRDGVWLDRGELEALQNNLRLDPAFLGGVALRLDEMRF